MSQWWRPLIFGSEDVVKVSFWELLTSALNKIWDIEISLILSHYYWYKIKYWKKEKKKKVLKLLATEPDLLTLTFSKLGLTLRRIILCYMYIKKILYYSYWILELQQLCLNVLMYVKVFFLFNKWSHSVICACSIELSAHRSNGISIELGCIKLNHRYFITAHIDLYF